MKTRFNNGQILFNCDETLGKMRTRFVYLASILSRFFTLSTAKVIVSMLLSLIGLEIQNEVSDIV